MFAPTFDVPRRLAAIVAASACLAGPADALTIDLSGAGGTGGFGNSLQFTAGGLTVDAFAWGETGALQTASPANYWYFQTAQIYSWSTGIGICNRLEGADSSCDTNEREIDTAGSRDDLLVLYFNQVVSFDNLEVTVDPWDGPGSDPNDRDLRYWISTVAGGPPDLGAYSFNTLDGAFGANTLSSASSSYNAYTHLLHNSGGPARSGNLLMLSGNFLNRNCTETNIEGDSECEAWKLRSVVVSPVTQVIPVPAAAWLLGSALGVLGIARRRSLP